METRKCVNIYFPKYFKAFYEDFFKIIIWVGGVNKFP